jgi:hypothetical protein
MAKGIGKTVENVMKEAKSRSRKSNEKQMEFNEMPERSPLGKKAMEYIDLRYELKSVNEKIEKCKADLVGLFQEAKVRSIKVEGNTVSYNHSESSIIKISKIKIGE